MIDCTIYDLLNEVDEATGRVVLYTDHEGLLNQESGNSFFVWTGAYANMDDVALSVCEKDLSEDVDGTPYVVDGLDAFIL